MIQVKRSEYWSGILNGFKIINAPKAAEKDPLGTFENVLKLIHAPVGTFKRQIVGKIKDIVDIDVDLEKHSVWTMYNLYYGVPLYFPVYKYNDDSYISVNVIYNYMNNLYYAFFNEREQEAFEKLLRRASTKSLLRRKFGDKSKDVFIYTGDNPMMNSVGILLEILFTKIVGCKIPEKKEDIETYPVLYKEYPWLRACMSGSNTEYENNKRRLFEISKAVISYFIEDSTDELSIKLATSFVHSNRMRRTKFESKYRRHIEKGYGLSEEVKKFEDVVKASIVRGKKFTASFNEDVDYKSTIDVSKLEEMYLTFLKEGIGNGEELLQQIAMLSSRDRQKINQKARNFLRKKQKEAIEEKLSSLEKKEFEEEYGGEMTEIEEIFIPEKDNEKDVIRANCISRILHTLSKEIATEELVLAYLIHCHLDDSSLKALGLTKAKPKWSIKCEKAVIEDLEKLTSRIKKTDLTGKYLNVTSSEEEEEDIQPSSNANEKLKLTAYDKFVSGLIQKAVKEIYDIPKETLIEKAKESEDNTGGLSEEEEMLLQLLKKKYNK